jgi:Ca2+-binding EF-hand superfamily protein
MKTLCAFGLCLIALTWAHGRASAQAPGNLREVFEALDANGDGQIEREEVPDDGRKAFDRLLKQGDANRDGKLAAEELRDLSEEVRAALGDEAVGAGEVRQRLLKMDRDGDGKVQKSEFDGPAEAFRRLDRDDDGAITPKDFQRPAQPAANALPPAMRRLDRNGDGKIERKEFPGRPAMFSKLDRNNDGVLSAAELRNARDGIEKAKKP